MNRVATFLLSAALLSLSAGCHAQLPTVPQLSCPPATGATYVALNSGGTTSISYTDSGMASGASYCYVVQWLPTGGGTSGPSNIAGPLTSPTSSATHQTLLSWTAPGSGGAYVVSRIAAISTVPTAPSLLNGTSTASIPMLEPTIAMNLKAKIGR